MVRRPGRGRQPRWPRGTQVAPTGKGPGGGRWRDDGKPNAPHPDSWAEAVSEGLVHPHGPGHGSGSTLPSADEMRAARRGRGTSRDATPDASLHRGGSAPSRQRRGAAMSGPRPAEGSQPVGPDNWAAETAARMRPARQEQFYDAAAESRPHNPFMAGAETPAGGGGAPPGDNDFSHLGSPEYSDWSNQVSGIMQQRGHDPGDLHHEPPTRAEFEQYRNDPVGFVTATFGDGDGGGASDHLNTPEYSAWSSEVATVMQQRGHDPGDLYAEPPTRDEFERYRNNPTGFVRDTFGDGESEYGHLSTPEYSDWSNQVSRRMQGLGHDPGDLYAEPPTRAEYERYRDNPAGFVQDTFGGQAAGEEWDPETFRDSARYSEWSNQVASAMEQAGHDPGDLYAEPPSFDEFRRYRGDPAGYVQDTFGAGSGGAPDWASQASSRMRSGDTFGAALERGDYDSASRLARTLGDERAIVERRDRERDARHVASRRAEMVTHARELLRNRRMSDDERVASLRGIAQEQRVGEQRLPSGERARRIREMLPTGGATARQRQLIQRALDEVEAGDDGTEELTMAYQGLSYSGLERVEEKLLGGDQNDPQIRQALQVVRQLKAEKRARGGR